MRTFRVFLSSTFNDLKAEREAFRETVVPDLRRFCRQRGASFEAVDLRWSISEEAGRDQRTMRICLAEVRRCLEATPRPNFVIMLGNRYGWRPVPSEIPASLFARVIDVCGPEARLLERWYLRDDNGLPPVYYLRRREGKYRNDKEWRAAGRDLLNTLQNAAIALKLPDSEAVLFGGSATEQEIQCGAFASDPRDRVFCFFRNIRGEVPDTVTTTYFDDADSNWDHRAPERLEKLKSRIRSTFGERVREYDAEWQGDHLSSDYVDLFCQDIQQSLVEVIERELSDPRHSDELETERDEHAAFAVRRTRVFIGREKLLEAIESHTMSSSRSAFGIVGSSGSGKSALMAKAAMEAVARHRDTAVVYRFAGLTPRSSDTLSLLRSLCQDVARAYSRETSVPRDYDQLVGELRSRLGYAHMGRPLIVFVDALDQLADIQARSALSWIPAELPPFVRLFVSAPPDLRSSVARVVQAEKIAILEPLSRPERSQIIEQLLRDSGRVLQRDQWSAVEERIARSPSPLDLWLLVQQMKDWRSGDGIHSLGEDVPALLNDLFKGLTGPAEHGEQLVRRSLGLLAAGRDGLSEDELLDNLSADDLTMKEFRERSVHSSGSRELPPIIWSRLRADLEAYLSARGADASVLLAFFHRQFREVVEDLFLNPFKAELHSRLAAYFGAQPLYLDDEGRLPNLRKLAELPFQQTGGALWKEAQNLLLDFSFLDAKVRALGPQALLDDFDRSLGAKCGMDSSVLEEVQAAIRARAHVLSGDPTQLCSQLTGRLCGSSKPEIVNLLHEMRRRTTKVWLRPMTRSLGTAGDALVRVLGGHQAIVHEVSVSQGGRYAVSAGNDNVCVIWDLEAFVPIHRLLHEEPVFAAVITLDERQVICAAGSRLALWDLARGIPIRSENTGVGWMRALCLTHDGTVAIFGSDKGVIGTWDLRTGAVTRPIQTFPINCLTVLPDNKTVVAGRLHLFDFDKFDWNMPGPLEVWNIQTAERIAKFGTGRGANSVKTSPDGRTIVAALENGKVELWRTPDILLEQSFRYSHWWADGATITPDKRYIVAGGADHCLRVWDTSNGELFATLKGHHNLVRTTAAMPDSHRILSGSDDQTVRLWDLQRARAVEAETAHGGKIHTLCQSPDGRLIVSGSTDKTVKLWDSAGSCVHTLSGHDGEVWSAAFAPDGCTLLTLQGNGRTIVWDTERRQQRRVLELIPRTSVLFNRVVPHVDNRHFFCGGEMFEIETGKVAYQLPEYETAVVAVLADGDHILFHGNGGPMRSPLRLWSLKRHCEVVSFPEAGWPVRLWDQSRMITNGYELGIWNVQTGHRLRTFPTGHRGYVNDIDFREDLGIAATASGDHDIKIWNIDSGERLATFTVESPLACCLISRSEPVVVTGDELGNLHFLRIEGIDVVRSRVAG